MCFQMNTLLIGTLNFDIKIATCFKSFPHLHSILLYVNSELDLLVFKRKFDDYDQVRLGEFSTSGAFRGTKKLAQHKGPAHKMSLLPDNQYCLLSAGEDGQVVITSSILIYSAKQNEFPTKFIFYIVIL